MGSRLVAVAILLSITASVTAAHADDVIPGHTVSRPVDGAIQILAFTAGLTAKLIPARDRQPWDEEVFGADMRVRDNFSRRAAHISDGLLGLSLAAPVVYLTGRTIDDVDGDRLLLYGQSMAINVALASVAKQLVQRPRPYTYSQKQSVRAYAKAQGTDAYLSFYSGHAAATFGAATTGAYLLGTSNASPALKSFAWGAGFGVAAMTASLRVRAGKHFYSDVLVGSLVGMTVGYVVPALHADDKPYVPSGQQVALMGGSILAGILVARLIPLGDRDSAERLDGVNLSIAPTVTETSMGLGLAGGW